MIANALNIERARADPAHGTPPPNHTTSQWRRLTYNIPEESSVLSLGEIRPEDVQSLEARGCRIQSFPKLDVVEFGRIELGRSRFDVVIAIDVLGRVPIPEDLIASLRRVLKSDGRLILSVPNAGHPSLLRSMARGESLYRTHGPVDLGQLRLFTAESLSEILQQADFVVGALQGILDPNAVDIEAWLALAYPLPVSGLQLLQDRFWESAKVRDEAERTVSTLRAMLGETRKALDSAHLRADVQAARRRESDCSVLELQRALVERDVEFEKTIRERFSELEELESLRRERDAAHRQALAAEARCRALEMRVEHVLMEFPRRIARKVRSRFYRKNPSSTQGGTVG